MNFNAILDWLSTGWGYILGFSAFISAFFTVKSNITKLVKELRQPIDNLDEKITDLNDKLSSDEELINSNKELNTIIAKEIDDISAKMDKMFEHDEMTDQALQAMLKSDILKSCEKYIKSGWATTDQKSTLNKQLDSYLALKGNSFIPKLVDQVMKLPLEDPKKKIINE